MSVQDRQRRGQRTGGQWAARQRSDDIELPTDGEAVRCPLCGRFRSRVDDHRCPVPGLINPTAPTRTVLDAIITGGGRPLFVGGAVRDAVLSRLHSEPVDGKDIDIEVYGIDAETVVEAVSATGAQVDEVGASFGVIKAVLDGEDFDISLPRRDSKTGSGHRGFRVDVDHTLDVTEAAGRRDFTINAMSFDADTGELIDPYAGAVDLDDRVLRHTGDAFADDPLRVLRGV